MFSPTQLWIIVALLPPLSVALLEHHPPAQPTKRQSSTPVTVDMKSPLESPQQQLPVWLMETGDLYQLVNVCINCFLTHVPNLNVTWLIDTGVSYGNPPSGTNAFPGTPSRTTYLGRVTYTCVTGYQISTGVTTANAICRADRTWGPILPVTCSGKSWIIKVVHVIYSPQLMTVVPWATPPMEQWTHPLEPPSWWLLPTPVTLDTLSLELWLEHVRLMECGASLHPPVVLVCLVL